MIRMLFESSRGTQKPEFSKIYRGKHRLCQYDSSQFTDGLLAARKSVPPLSQAIKVGWHQQLAEHIREEGFVSLYKAEVMVCYWRVSESSWEGWRDTDGELKWDRKVRNGSSLFKSNMVGSFPITRTNPVFCQTGVYKGQSLPAKNNLRLCKCQERLCRAYNSHTGDLGLILKVFFCGGETFLPINGQDSWRTGREMGREGIVERQSAVSGNVWPPHEDHCQYNRQLKYTIWSYYLHLLLLVF